MTSRAAKVLAVVACLGLASGCPDESEPSPPRSPAPPCAPDGCTEGKPRPRAVPSRSWPTADGGEGGAP